MTPKRLGRVTYCQFAESFFWIGRNFAGTVSDVGGVWATSALIIR